MEPKLINVHNDKEISLPEGKYHINIVGGWSIKLNDFSIELEHIDTAKVIKPETSVWPVQSFWKGRRAKRAFYFEITESGNYKLRFKNPDKLIVRHSRLLMHRLFTEPVEHKYLDIIIKMK